MDTTISIQQIEKLRREFKEYLRASYPDWSENTISMHYSDSFYIFNNDVGLDFWACFTSEAKMLEAHDKLYSHFAIDKQSDRARERANGYLSSMKLLKR